MGPRMGPRMRMALFRLVALAFCAIYVDGFALRSEARQVLSQMFSCKSDTGSASDDMPMAAGLKRRTVLASSVGISFAKAFSVAAAEVNLPPETIVLKGTVTLAPDVSVDVASYRDAALYVTCRPDKEDDVPAAILNGTRGKSPPVLSSKILNPSFPTDFELSIPRDLTPEGASDGTSSKLNLNLEEVWWKDSDLIVSARWDSDGTVTTRSPEDLVGRGFSKRGNSGAMGSKAEIQLTGRGAFGKFATGGSSKGGKL